MKGDGLQIFRDLLSGGSNKLATLAPSHDTANTATQLGGGGGGGQSTGPGFGGGRMDPWQSSVESRLGALETRLGKIDDKLGDARTDLAAVKARVDELPTKWFLVTAIGIIGGAIVALAKLVEMAL